ncbi:putative C-14 sterol reductase [Diplonema papillatum]|nr:putative C-14 sterol reductase [Diplonema papillatum]
MLDLKWRHFIDASKGLTLPVCLATMYHMNKCDSPTAMTYTALHGCYGILWVLKSNTFPDSTWERPNKALQGAEAETYKKGQSWTPMDIVGQLFGKLAGTVVFGALAGYWANIVIICKKKEEAPLWLRTLCVGIWGIGVFLHFSSDMQKHVHLKHKKGLITDMLFARTRNPNYLGELLIYGTFAALTQEALPAAYLALNFFVFWLPNMLKKDKSISRYPGWSEYSKRSTMFIPFVY